MNPNRSANAEDIFAITSVAIKLLDTKVYRNGRQQARIELTLEVTRGGKDAYLTEAEEKGIRLLDYGDPLVYLPFDDRSGDAAEGWSAQHESRKYDFHPESGSTRTGLAATEKAIPPKKYFFFVSAGTNASGNLRVAFAFTGDDGSIWRTTGWVTYPGAAEDEYEANVHQGEDITVQQVPPIVYSWRDIVLSRSPIAGPKTLGEQPELAYFNDFVTVSIVAPGGAVIPIREMTCDPAGLIHWVDLLPTTRNPCFTGYVPPGSTTIIWNDKVNTGAEPLPTMASPLDNSVFILCGRLDIARYPDAPEGAAEVRLVDTYGTSQTFRIQFKKGTRDELEVM